MPAIVGLLLAGIFADGAAGAGWQATGATSYLGVAPGCVGPFVAVFFSARFPGQFQSQLIGIAAISIWGLVSGLVVCAPLGLLFTACNGASANGQSLGPACHASCRDRERWPMAGVPTNNPPETPRWPAIKRRSQP